MRLGDSVERDNEESCEQSYENSENSGEFDCDNWKSEGRHDDRDDECESLYEERRFARHGSDGSEQQGASARMLPHESSSRWQQFEEAIPFNDNGCDDNADEDGMYVTVLPGGKRRRASSDICGGGEGQKTMGRGKAGESGRATRKDGWSADYGRFDRRTAVARVSSNACRLHINSR